MPGSQCLLTSTPASFLTADSKLLPSSVLPLRTLDSWARRSTTVATVPRRLFLVSAYAIWDALTGGAGGPARAASTAVRRGMLLFRQGNVSESLAEFDRAIVLDPRQKAYLQKGQINSGWMLQRIQMILRSPFGASSVKLKFMEWMKPGNVSWRLAQILGLSCVKSIVCLKMAVTLRSLFQLSQTLAKLNAFMLLSMLVSIMSLRMKWTLQKFILLQPVRLHMDQSLYHLLFFFGLRKIFTCTGFLYQLPMVFVAGLMIIWPP